MLGSSVQGPLDIAQMCLLSGLHMPLAVNRIVARVSEPNMCASVHIASNFSASHMPTSTAPRAE